MIEKKIKGTIRKTQREGVLKMNKNAAIVNTLNDIIECLAAGKYEAAGGKMFYLWENIEDEVGDPALRDMAVEMTNKAAELILGDDPSDLSAELNVYKLGEEGMAEAVRYLKALITLFS